MKTCLMLIAVVAIATGTPLAYFDEDYFGTYVSRDRRMPVRFAYCDAGETTLEAFGERYSADEFTIELLGLYGGSQVMEVRFVDQNGLDYRMTLLVFVEDHRVQLAAGHIVSYRQGADGRSSIDTIRAVQFRFKPREVRSGEVFDCAM